MRVQTPNIVLIDNQGRIGWSCNLEGLAERLKFFDLPTLQLRPDLARASSSAWSVIRIRLPWTAATRFSALPKIETVLVKNDEIAPPGAGEPAIVPLGGAVANALFDAVASHEDGTGG